MRALLPVISAAALCLSTGVSAHADDWPQWLGPQRDGVYREEGVVSEIPDGGLPIKWSADVGYGYAGPAVADGRVYLFDYVVESGEIKNLPSTRDELAGSERLTAYDAATGDVVWRREYAREYAVSYGGGPRCTPTVDGDRVYTLGAEGDLVCRQTADGEELWRRSFRDDFGVTTPIWGHSAHPLVVGDLLVCVVGGPGSVAVAFDKLSGEERWRNLSAGEPGYCPPTLIRHNGAQQLLIWHPESLNALRPTTGEVVWSLPVRPSFGMSITQPRQLDDKLYIGAIGNVSVLMQLRPDGSDVDVLWSGGPKQGVRTANATAHLEAGVVYGVDCETSQLMAVSMVDGERLWTTQEPVFGGGRARHGTAFLVRHETAGAPTGRYFLFNELGELITAELTADSYTETGRMPVLAPTSSAFGRPVVWSHPAFAGRAVFARNDEKLVCVDLSE
ncbi:MAG: PQQ-binding-like beta-propeller repeat protein [Planctomycetota bacterium]